MTWELKTIGSLGRIVTGKTPSTKIPEYFEGEIPFVTPSDINYQHYYCVDTSTKVNEKVKDKFKNQIIPRNSVIFTCIGNTIGKCAIANSECLTNQQMNSIIANSDNDPIFIYYLLNNNIDLIRGIGMGGGAATPIINKTTFSNIKLQVPEKITQSTISNILSQYDNLIENNRRRIQLLEKIARLLYKEWFVYLRFPGCEKTGFVNGIPNGWITATLNDLASAVKETIDPTTVSHDTPYIGLEHIPRKSITLNIWGNASDVESTKYKFIKNDIIFGKIRPYFHKVGFALTDGITSSDSLVLRAKIEDLWGLTLMTTSSDHFVAVASKTVREGSKMPRADWSVLKKFKIAIPPKGLLTRFNELIMLITQQCRFLSLQNNKLAEARDILLPKLMSGEISV